MRKTRILVVLTLCLCFIVSLSGCAEKADSTENADANVITIANFEQWQPDFGLMRVMPNFGKVTKNDDVRFVKSGKSSAKLQPLGGKSDIKLPLMYFPTVSTRFGYDYSDFSKVESVDMWIYNAEDKEMRVTVGFLSAIVNAMEVETMRGETFTLASAEWTHVKYYPSREVLSITGDLSAVPGIYLEFENQNARELKDAPVIYLDDVTINKNPDLEEVDNVMSFDDGKVLDFEQTWQKYAVYAKSTNAKCKADVEVVKTVDYGVTGLQGDYALRVVTHKGDLFEGSYPAIVIPEKIMQACGMKGVPKDDYGKTSLEFDVYNDNDYVMRFFVEVGSKTTGGNYAMRCEVNAKSKVHYKVSFFEAEEHNAGSVSDPSTWKISWAEYTDRDDQVFYFDNFRIVKEK